MKRILITLALVAVAQGAYAQTTAYPEYPETSGVTNRQDFNTAGGPITSSVNAGDNTFAAGGPTTSGLNTAGGPTTSGTNKAQTVKRAAGKDLKNPGNRMHKNTGITSGTNGL